MSGAARSPLARRAHAAVELHDLHDRLAGRRSLAPGPETDALFGRLVELVLTMDDREAEAVLADPSVRTLRPRLQRLCAEGETELERTWAARIANSRGPEAELERFPYVGNYRLLTQLEWSLVLGAGPARPRRIAFVGSGPLPLSALCLARDHDVVVDTLDRDPRAVTLARGVIDALAVRGVHVRLADALRCPDLQRYDLVVLAALVGATTETKRTVITRVGARMRPGALLAVRSAHAARSLLYPVLDLGALTGFDLLRVVHPYDQVVNSVVLARKPVEPAAAPCPAC